MKTSALACRLGFRAGAASECPAQSWLFNAGNPIRRLGGATAALQFGVGKQFREFRLVSGRKQRQSAQQAADRYAPGRPIVALARPAGNLQPEIIDPLEEGEACFRAPLLGASRAKQGDRAELAFDDTGRLQLGCVDWLHPEREVGTDGGRSV